MIEEKKLIFLNTHKLDMLGELCETMDRKMFRRISKSKEKYVIEMFESGMIHELMEKNLIPKTKIADRDFDYLYIEIERIPYIVYPYEWSFDMLRSAAECVLHVNKIALQYGYQLVDPHAYNVVFKGTVPLYVDLGSFSKVNRNSTDWEGKDDFKKSYVYPLKIAGNRPGFAAPTLARRLVGIYIEEISIKENMYFFIKSIL